MRHGIETLHNLVPAGHFTAASARWPCYFPSMTRTIDRRRAIFERNRLDAQLANLRRLRKAEAERIRALEEARRPKAVAGASADAVRDKVAVIRNRLTGKKRVSRERWNRFATTGDAGGRGL